MIINIGRTTINLYPLRAELLVLTLTINYVMSFLRSQCVKDLGVLFDSKLYLHQHIDYIFSQGFSM
jgi:hypothetical protein